MDKREAFRIVFDELNRFADARLKGKTAHDARCRAVKLTVNLGTGDFCGELVLEGAKSAAPEDKLLNSIFIGNTTNTLDFNDLNELLEAIGVE